MDSIRSSCGEELGVAGHQSATCTPQSRNAPDLNNVPLPNRLTHARDHALQGGITINGLPVVIKSPRSVWDMAELDSYYRDCVIGGVDAFMVAIHRADQFKDAVRTKLIREITGYEGRPSLIAPAQSAADCLSGEKRRKEEQALSGEGHPLPLSFRALALPSALRSQQSVWLSNPLIRTSTDG